MRYTPTHWTTPIIADLTQMWGEGLLVSEISRRLSAKYHVAFSRNAVIGKVHRLSLAARPSPIRRSAA